jgi:hypothetical protein
MVQAKWAETIAAGLLCAGLAIGQASHTGPKADLAPNSVVNFRETGKPDRKCKVVRRWRDSRGRWAYELEMLDSHEHQVIFEPGSEPCAGQPDRASTSVKSTCAPAAPLCAPPGSNFAITPAAMASQTPPGIPPASSGSQSPAAASSAGAMESGLVEGSPADNAAPGNDNTRRGAAGLMGLLRDRVHPTAQNSDNGQSVPPGLPANEPNAFSQPVRQARFPGLHRADDSNSPYAGSPTAFSMYRQQPAQPVGYMTQSTAKSASTVLANASQGPAPLIPVPNVNPQDTQQLISVLQNAGYPSQREWAAEMLAKQWTGNAEIVPALTLASRQDPAESVRKACVICLTKIQRNDITTARYNDRPR